MIEWSISPEIVSLGPLSVRWYGLLFASSFIIGLQIMLWIYKKEDKNIDDLNDLVWFMVLGTVIGARLGHCLFYNPEYYLGHPLEILKVWKGGLASHGAALGIIAGLYLYMRKGRKYSYLWLIDRVAITVALAGFFIRTGNLFNSEIIGTETTMPWAFKFVHIDMVPRHPAQLYEALAYLAVFVILVLWYKKKNSQIPEGSILGVFLVLVFGVRFLVEFIKEDQTYFEAGMLLNMGQLLSIPAVLGGVYLLYRANKHSIPTQT